MGAGDGFELGVAAGSAQQFAYVVSDGGLGEVESGGDLADADAVAEQEQDLLLAGSEPGRCAGGHRQPIAQRKAR